MKKSLILTITLVAATFCAGCYFSPDKRAFAPNARVYFDVGTDDPGEVDVFNDGSLNFGFTGLELFTDFRDMKLFAKKKNDNGKDLNENEIYENLKDERETRDDWFGLALGFGLSGTANDSESGETASNSPVGLVNFGIFYEFEYGRSKDDKPLYYAFELGYAWAYSSDEGFTDSDDGAIYVGFSVPIGIDTKKRRLKAEQSTLLIRLEKLKKAIKAEKEKAEE